MKGILEGVALKHQYKLIYSQKKFPAIVGGYGSGKSEGLILRTLRQKFKYPTLNYAYYLPTFDLVKQIAFPRFEEILINANIPYTLNKSDGVLHIDNFGKIIFRTMDKPERIVGYEVADSSLDELDTLPIDKAREVWTKALARNRQKKPDGQPNTMAVGTTPEGFRFTYERWVKKGGDEYELINARTYDNKFLPDDYIPSLEEQYPPNLLEAYLNGKFINLTSGTVYNYFNRDKHHTDIEAKETDTLHIGQDFNVGGSVSTIFIIKDGKPIQVDEVVSNDTFGVVTNIRAKYTSNRVIMYPDASGDKNSTNATKSDIQILRDAGFIIDAPKANGRVRDRINSVNTLLSHDNFLINTNNCPKTTESLEQQAYDKNGEPEKLSGGATLDDFVDSLGYFLVRKYPIKRNTIKRTPFKAY